MPGASNTAGFVTLSKAFEAYFMGSTAFFNKCEWRAKTVYDLDKEGKPPWTWDYDNYSGENSDMVGFYYSEDIENIMQLKRMDKDAKK